MYWILEEWHSLHPAAECSPEFRRFHKLYQPGLYCPQDQEETVNQQQPLHHGHFRLLAEGKPDFQGRPQQHEFL